MRTVLAIVMMVASAATTAAQTPPPSTDYVVITVNGDPIYAGEVQMAAQQIGQSMAASGQQVDGARIGSEAVQQVVSGRLLVQEARRRKIEIAPSEVQEALADAEKQSGGTEQMDAELERQGLTRERLHTMAVESMLLSKLIEQLTKDAAVSEEQVATFYQENQKVISTPEQVNARHILFKVEADADEATVAEARKKAEAAQKRAVDGEDFATLAKELSEGPSGPKGGDLGFFTRERMVAPFSEAAFALDVGGTSEVVKTTFGFHIIRVEARNEAMTPPIEEVEERIREGLLRQAQGEMVQALLKTLNEDADIVTIPPPGVEIISETVPAG